MSVTDWKYPGTAVSVSSDWEDPNNAKADDSNYSVHVFYNKNASSALLRLTNFGFTSSDLPSGCTINGIEFVIGRYASVANYISDSALYLYDDGQVGSNLASATKWPTSEGAATYGGATNMCGTSLTQADIVASTFGVQLSAAVGNRSNATAYVDYIKIRVYYTEGGASVKPYYYYLNQ